MRSLQPGCSLANMECSHCISQGVVHLPGPVNPRAGIRRWRSAGLPPLMAGATPCFCCCGAPCQPPPPQDLTVSSENQGAGFSSNLFHCAAALGYQIQSASSSQRAGSLASIPQVFSQHFGVIPSFGFSQGP